MEVIMKYKLYFIGTAVLLSALLLSACNLPSKQVPLDQTATPVAIIGSSSTPTPVTPPCHNPYYPNTIGNAWEYSGTNTAVGNYSRSDSIITSSNDAFTQATTQYNVTYPVTYSCTSAGLFASNPVQVYAGALLSNPNFPADVQLTSNSGITFPAKITPSDSWQQTSGFDATAKDINLTGTFVFEYTAVGYESITVPSGTYNALRVNGTIKIEVSGFRILVGTYTTTTWLVQDIGIVKSEGTSHVPGVEFTDNMELTRFTPAP
jgi:hypothetical protein